MISSEISAKADALIPEQLSAGRTRYPSEITSISAIPQIIPELSTRKPAIFDGLLSGASSCGKLSAGNSSIGTDGAVSSSGREGTAVSGRDISGTDGFLSSGISAVAGISTVPAAVFISCTGFTGSSAGISVNTALISSDNISSAPESAASLPVSALPVAPVFISIEYTPVSSELPASPSSMPITASTSRMRTAVTRSTLWNTSDALHPP